MITRLSTGPGMFAAFTTPKMAPGLALGNVRMLCARLEVYDVTEAESEVSFKLLPAMAEGKPEVADALLQLAKTIELNRKLLEAEAKKGRS